MAALLVALIGVPVAGAAPEQIEDPDDQEGWLPDQQPAVTPAPTAGPTEPAVDWRASAVLRLALDVGHEGARPDQAGALHEDVMELFGQAAAHLKYRARPWARLALGLRLEYRLTARLPLQDADYYLFNGDLHRSDFTMVPADSYLGITAAWLDLRLGLVTAVWGAANLVNPNDVITARDLTNGPPVVPESARLPLPMVQADLFIGPINVTVAWLPVFMPDRVEALGSDFAMFGPAAPPRLRALGQMADGLVDHSVLGVIQPALLQTHLPRPVRDSSLAFRVKGSLAGWDLSAQYAYLFQRQATVRLRTFMLPLLPTAGQTVDPSTLGSIAGLLLSQGTPLEAKYRRTHHAGLSASKALWDVLLCVDLAYTSRVQAPLAEIPRSAPGQWLALAAESQQLAYTVGATYTRGEELLVNLEWWHRVLVDLAAEPAEARADLLLGGPHLGGLALLARYEISAIHLTLQAGAVADLFNPSLVLSAQVTYRALDALAVFAGVNLFEGQDRSMGGSLDPNDQVFVGVQGFM